MAEFSGFEYGCPGISSADYFEYWGATAQFEAGGKRIEPSTAGEVEPDSIRIVQLDEYRAPMWSDTILAFSDDAELQIAHSDPHVPEGNVHVLNQEQIEKINSLCGSCATREQVECPILRSILESNHRTASELPANRARDAEAFLDFESDQKV